MITKYLDSEALIINYTIRGEESYAHGAYPLKLYAGAGITITFERIK